MKTKNIAQIWSIFINTTKLDNKNKSSEVPNKEVNNGYNDSKRIS